MNMSSDCLTKLTLLSSGQVIMQNTMVSFATNSLGTWILMLLLGKALSFCAYIRGIETKTGKLSMSID